ncbi:M1 family metallopeptidase [Rudaea sp.]|uniref:M1 family metallopeptidase n=1 Tax=Rudaea sp. TaxID=2136325 RepID=UPI0039C97B39
MIFICRTLFAVTLGLAAMPALHAANIHMELDPHSYAQPDKVRVTALDLDLSVSFDKHELAGSATLDLDWRDKAARELVLDTRDLKIDKIEAVDKSGKWSEAKFSLDQPEALRGSALRIALPAQNRKVRIVYATSPDAAGLQWLDPGQTAGKKYPFMYSQSESIAGRSWVPLQDSPSVRFSYTAHVHTPKELRAVMSARSLNESDDAHHALDGDFHFVMPQKIPSYLLALAIGDIAVKETGPRSAVYAEPETVAAAAKEFEDVETMIATTEKLYGPYRWQRYDILVLPPSFPYGGMENPRLTFATPTVIAGDKSLVSVIAHELAHSWSGNLVTNAAWRHVWLNEGFTTYVQGRIVEAVYGKQQADEEFLVAAAELRKTYATAPAAEQLLVPDLTGKDADDSLSDTPYTKGSWFLQTLEAKFGRDTFDRFLRSYFDHFAFQSITTDQFVAYLKANLLDKYPGKFNMDEVNVWLHQPGIPAAARLPSSARFAEQDKLREQFVAGKLDAAGLGAKTWRTQEWQYFLDQLPAKLSAAQMQDLDDTWHLTGTHNAVIAFRWYRLAIGSDYRAAFAAMREHMLRVGRMILVVPLYEALVKTPQGKALAEKIYAEAKPGYHPITRGAVEKALAGKK